MGKKQKDWSQNKRQHSWRCKTHNEESQEEKSSKVGLKPIISNTNQFMQGDGRKTWKNTKLDHRSHPFVGLAYRGKGIVFRFIIEYSSLRDFVP